MQKELHEMKEQENSSLWHDSPYQISGQHKRTLRENFFTGNEISQFADPESQVSHHGPQSTNQSLFRSTMDM
jgi:hypothetical protein